MADLYPALGLPRDLGDGLTLRWARPEDAEELARFNSVMHAEEPDRPDEVIYDWTLDLMSGRHPTTRAEDFTVVVDERQGGRIVSSICLISQTWAYAGIPFPMDRPELVASDPAYRRRGLVRTQFEVIHARSAERGELVQGITGIPYYYRQFGYAMALDLDPGRRLQWLNLPKLAKDQTEAYQLRRATADDLPLLARLYEYHRAADLVSRVRTEAEWRYELSGPAPKTLTYEFWLVEDQPGQPVGYVEGRPSLTTAEFLVRELAVFPEHSWRAICECAVRALKTEVDRLNQTRSEPLTHLRFLLNTAHPAMRALDQELDKIDLLYAWYIRVPDLPVLLRHIAPALERRLADSAMAGHSGTLRLNFYRSQLALTFEQGRLAEVGSWQPRSYDEGDALFPDLTFLHLLFGHRSLADLQYAWPDCRTEDARTTLLLNILFPQQPSYPKSLE